MQADILSAAEIKKYFTKERKNNIAVFDTVDSTNTILKNWCAEGKARPGDCVTADCQTKGRGRRGKRFESDKGVGIYLSFLLGTGDATPDEISEITAWGAVAVRRAIEKVCHAGSKIKWVNDIVCGRMKICGILTEMTSAGPVMGIGINVNQSEDGFPPELRNIASSLKIICKREFCRAQIIAAVIEELDLINAGFPEKKRGISKRIPRELRRYRRGDKHRARRRNKKKDAPLKSPKISGLKLFSKTGRAK
ncbi:MAG: biotin--[acetyl-CoA-carboxylase] ligase [Acutalibacteraceae bacterium]